MRNEEKRYGCSSRRRFLDKVGKAAVALGGLYSISKIPISYEQVTQDEVGTLHVPVTLDGRVEESEWYNDSIPYTSAYVPLAGFGVTTSHPYQMVFRTKHDDEYTYFAMDVPKIGPNTNPTFALDFDTLSIGHDGAGTHGYYTLELNPGAGNASVYGWYEANAGSQCGHKIV